MQVLQPAGWDKPRGYSNGVAAEGRLVFVAGQIGWTPDGVFAETGFGGQFRQTIENTLAVLAEAGAGPEHIVRMTWYVTDKREYLSRGREIGAVFRELIGVYHAAMSAVQVSALMEDRAKVEIEVTAVTPR